MFAMEAVGSLQRDMLLVKTMTAWCNHRLAGRQFPQQIARNPVLPLSRGSLSRNRKDFGTF
jgi:hypothetical protein